MQSMKRLVKVSFIYLPMDGGEWFLGFLATYHITRCRSIARLVVVALLVFHFISILLLFFGCVRICLGSLLSCFDFFDFREGS